jgi:hypothetical protein
MLAVLQLVTLIWLTGLAVHARLNPFLNQAGEAAQPRRRATPPTSRYLFDWEKAAGPTRAKLVVQNDKTASR